MNLKDYIHLPAEYEIKKKLTKERFLKSGSLTDYERDLIRRLVISIDLLYDVKFSDKSEVILMDILILRRESYKTDKRIAQIIAQAIPYPCITHVHADGFGEISVFLTRPSCNDDRRRVIEKQTSSPIFDLNNPPKELCELFDRMEIELSDHRHGADATIRRIVYHLEECKFRYRLAKKEAERRGEGENLQSLFSLIYSELAYGESHADEILDHGIQYEYDVNLDGKVERQIAEESLCLSAYALFQEAIDIAESDWLVSYAMCCTEVLSDLFKTPTDSSFYQMLGAVFSRKEVVSSDDDCIIAVRERLEEEYELLW